jgi:hypothetical protein
MKDQRIWRVIPGGAPVAAGTSVVYRTHAGDALLSTVTTDATGLATYSQDGHPGPYYATMTSGGTTRVVSSKSTGTAGPANLAALPDYFRLFTDGVIDGIDSELAVSAAGATMNSTTAKGQAVVKGVLYDMISASLNLTHGAADLTNPRIDTVIVRVYRPGHVWEGKADLAIVAGTPNASPVAPTLTQTATVWEFPLADVRVNAGVLVIAADKVTDRRAFAGPMVQANAITAGMMTAEGTLSTTDQGRYLRAPVGSGLTPTWALLGLGALNDVTDSVAVDGDTIIYDAATSKFIYQSNEVPTLRAGQMFAATVANLSSTTMTDFGTTDSFVLVSGVTYDIDALAVFETDPQPSRNISLRLVISGTGVAGGTGPNGMPNNSDQRVATCYHFVTVVGSGQTITIKVQGAVDAVSANNYVEGGFFRALALPRR